MKWGLFSFVPRLSPMFGGAVAPGGRRGDGGCRSEVAIEGTIVSVDAGSNSFAAQAYAPSVNGDRESHDARREGYDPSGDSSPRTIPVTITTNSGTEFRVGGEMATISSLAPGARFRALFDGVAGSDIATLVANKPALNVDADVPAQLYAFVGTVTAVTTADSGSGGTVSVDVTNSIPPEIASSASKPVTFTVAADTLVLGGSGAGGLSVDSLMGVSVGDVVAGGLIVAAGDTLSEVEGAPLRLLLDFPASSVTHVRRTVQ
jgi:hypothetical protein